MPNIPTTLARSVFRDYVRIARSDHWVKNVFMLPGVLFAVILTGQPILDKLSALVIGLVSL